MMTPSVSSNLVTETSALPLKEAALRCDARAGVARVVLVQRFENTSRQPMRVIYTLPLPAESAVSGFRFRIGERTLEGTIDKRDRARERFEEAIAEGKTAALLEQDRSTLFTQELGNVPPGTDIECEIEIDQRLRWLDEGSWEWRFPLAAAPRYLGNNGRVADASVVTFDVAEQLGARASLFMRVRDDVIASRSPESPSHPLSCVAEGAAFRVELGAGNAVPLDRDVVVRWPVAIDRASTSLDVAGPRRDRLVDAHALVTLVPPRARAIRNSAPRDLTLLLDTSGSMGGAPIEQAKRVALAMIDSLGERDRFEMIEFSSSPRRFQSALVTATADAKRTAAGWIRDLRASGGTEMLEGILEALRPRGRDARDPREGAMAQVVLVTDGLIGFEQTIIKEILALLPSGARLHTVGVGSSVNRSLTGPAARAGRGVEVVIGLGEDPVHAVTRLRARSVAPLVTEIEASGSALLEVAPMKVPDLFAGAPVLLSARVRREGGDIVLRGRTPEGMWEERVRIGETHEGEGSDAIATLFAREAVEDAEMRAAAGNGASATNASVESLGLAYRIATRLTSWVAIDSSASVDPRDPSRRVEMPQALPYGTSAESFGLRPAAVVHGYAMAAPAFAGMERMRKAGAPAAGAPPRPQAPSAPPAPREMPPASGDRGRDDSDDESRGATRSASKAKKRSFIERVRGAFTGASSSTIVWIGRIVVARAGQIIVEITIEDRTLAWTIGSHAHVLLAVGGSRQFAIDELLSTRSGSYTSGTTVRFALQVPADFDASSLANAHVIIGDVHVEIGA